MLYIFLFHLLDILPWITDWSFSLNKVTCSHFTSSPRAIFNRAFLISETLLLFLAQIYMYISSFTCDFIGQFSFMSMAAIKYHGDFPTLSLQHKRCKLCAIYISCIRFKYKHYIFLFPFITEPHDWPGIVLFATATIQYPHAMHTFA